MKYLVAEFNSVDAADILDFSDASEQTVCDTEEEVKEYLRSYADTDNERRFRIIKFNAVYQWTTPKETDRELVEVD